MHAGNDGASSCIFGSMFARSMVLFAVLDPVLLGTRTDAVCFRFAMGSSLLRAVSVFPLFEMSLCLYCVVGVDESQ